MGEHTSYSGSSPKSQATLYAGCTSLQPSLVQFLNTYPAEDEEIVSIKTHTQKHTHIHTHTHIHRHTHTCKDTHTRTHERTHTHTHTHKHTHTQTHTHTHHLSPPLLSRVKQWQCIKTMSEQQPLTIRQLKSCATLTDCPAVHCRGFSSSCSVYCLHSQSLRLELPQSHLMTANKCLDHSSSWK